MKKTKNSGQETILSIRGMHCLSCEILVEKILLQLPGVRSAKASLVREEVLIEYIGECPDRETMKNLLAEQGYHIACQEDKASVPNPKTDLLAILGISCLVIAVFLLLEKTGLSQLINVDSSSSLPIFFLFGLLAGVSSCAALVGGLVLSLSKQWSEFSPDSHSPIQRFQPHLLFNVGRLISYAGFGAVLGAAGSLLRPSPFFSSLLVMVISGIMIILGLQMLGVKWFRTLRFTMPRFITRYATNERHFIGRYMPFLMGGLTFFLPCGFTITAQGLALLSGSAWAGSLIMLFFALGTLPILLFIGISSTKILNKPSSSALFSRVAGVLVLFFALYTFNAQLNVLGFWSLNRISLSPLPTVSTVQKSSSIEGFPPLQEGKQIITMEASVLGYTPKQFRVKAGIPVRWEIIDKGTSGCTNAVISKDLFDGEIKLTRGQTSVKEFIPLKAGTYSFSCWMGMITGVIEVVN